MKAYRLTPQAIQMYKEGEFTPEALRNVKVSITYILNSDTVYVGNPNIELFVVVAATEEKSR